MERKPEQISRDIAAFERKLSEAGANEVLIEALNKKLSKLKNELKGGQMSTRQLASNLLGARKKVREMAGKDFRELISRLSRKPEYYFLKKYSKTEIKDDMARPAKPVGYRFVGRGNYEAPSKRQIKKGLADGTVYSERRPKRSDVSRVAQLGKGGKITIKDVDWVNDDNKQLGVWLLTSVDGNKILSQSTSKNTLEDNVMKYYKNKGSIAKMKFDEDSDDGLSWVTFGDLYNEVRSVGKEKLAKGGKTPEKRKFIVKVQFYERYSEGAEKTYNIEASSFLDLLYKLQTKSDISYYISELAEDATQEEKNSLKEMSEEELIEKLEMSNGDGGDYFTIIEKENGKQIVLVGGEEESEKDYYFATGGKIETFFKKLKSKQRQKGTSNLYSYEFSYQDAPYIKITDLQQIKTMRDELQDLMKEHIDYKYNLLLLDKKEGLEIDGYRTQISVEDLKHYLDLSGLVKKDRDLAKKELAKIAMFAIKSSGLKKETYGYRGKSTQSYSVNTLTKMATGGKTPEKRKFIVKVQFYERYSEGAEKTYNIEAFSFLDLLYKLQTKSDISYYISELEEDATQEEKNSLKEMSEEELIEKLEMSNGDGGDYLTIIEKENGKQIVLVGGEEESEKDYYFATGGGVDKNMLVKINCDVYYINQLGEFNQEAVPEYELEGYDLEEILNDNSNFVYIDKGDEGFYDVNKEEFTTEDGRNTRLENEYVIMIKSKGGSMYAKGGEVGFSTMVREVLSKHGITKNEIFKIYVDKPSKKKPNKRSIKVRLIGYKFNDNTDLAKKIGDDLIKLGAIKETILINNQEISFSIDDFKNTNKMPTGGSVKGNAEKGYEIIAYADDIILRNTDLDSKVLEKLMREKNVTNADILASLSKDWETGEFTREQLNIIQNLGLTSKMATGGDVDDVQAWIRYDGYSDKQIESVFDGLEEAGYDFPKDFKIYESNQESFTNKVWGKSNAMSTDIRIETLPGDLTRKDVSVIIYGMIMTASTQFGLGGDIKAFFSATKETLKKGYNKSKEYTKKKIHDTSKKIALDVIDNTKDKVRSNRDKMTLKGAEEIVSKKYAKGGGVGKSRDFIVKIDLYEKYIDGSDFKKEMKLKAKNIYDLFEKLYNKNTGISYYLTAFEFEETEELKQMSDKDLCKLLDEEMAKSSNNNYFTIIEIIDGNEIVLAGGGVNEKYAKGGGVVGKEKIVKVSEGYYEDENGNAIALNEEEDGSGYYFLDTTNGFSGGVSKSKATTKDALMRYIAKNYNVVRRFAKGGQVDDYIDEKENQFANDEYEMREIHGSDYKDIEYLGFLAIDDSLRDNRLSDYLFEGEEFYRENLLEVVKMYPQAKEIYFGARIMGENAFGIEEDGYSEIDDIAMVFDMDKLNQYARGGAVANNIVESWKKENEKREPGSQIVWVNDTSRNSIYSNLFYPCFKENIGKVFFGFNGTLLRKDFCLEVRQSGKNWDENLIRKFTSTKKTKKESVEDLKKQAEEWLSSKEMATGGNVNNYPSFEVAKTIRVDDMVITAGYYTYMGRENGGKGVYLNVHTKQTLGFDLDMLKSIKEKHPTDIQILMKKGGRVKKGNYSYIPQEEIDYLVTEYGKKIDGNNLLDGAYAKGNTKAPKMVRTQFEEEDYEFAKGGSIPSVFVIGSNVARDRYGYDIEQLLEDFLENVGNYHDGKTFEEDNDFAFTVARGDDFPNAITFMNMDFLKMIMQDKKAMSFLKGLKGNNKYAKGGEITVWNLKKGDKIRTRKGDIETVERKIESGYFTEESVYSHPFEGIEFVSRPGRKMATGGSMGSRINYQNDDFALVMLGGSIGSKTSLPIFVNGKMGSIVETGNNKEMLKEKAARMRKQLSAGERKHYGMSYTVVALTPAKTKEIERFKNK